VTAPILIYGLDDALAALAAAQALGCAVTLIGPPAVATAAGAGWFCAVVAAARGAYPGVAVTAVLDCGDWPGLALAGIRAGVAHLRFSGDADSRERLAALAAAVGAAVHDQRAWAGPALDLRGRRDGMTACRDWLGNPALARSDT
jgi:hypothetical protein